MPPDALAHYNDNEYMERRREALHAWADRIEKCEKLGAMSEN